MNTGRKSDFVERCNLSAISICFGAGADAFYLLHIVFHKISALYELSFSQGRRE
jgi:hypothetical protein